MIEPNPTQPPPPTPITDIDTVSVLDTLAVIDTLSIIDTVSVIDTVAIEDNIVDEIIDEIIDEILYPDLTLFDLLPDKGITSNEKIIEHTFYTLEYNEAYEQAKWIIYFLREEMLDGDVERSNNFRADPFVSTGSASLADYRNSGYDRGHLVPAGDMTSSELGMSESFYLSNMSPQTAGFNRGVWKRLENAVRGWAEDFDEIYVVMGGVLSSGNLDTIGDNRVGIPEQYYKIILDYKEPEVKAIGFLLDHESSSEPLSSFAVTIDAIETITGIDFFPALNDVLERELESNIDISLWDLD